MGGTCGPLRWTPAPAGVAPKFPGVVTAGLDECGELPIGDGSACDPEGFKLDRERPFLVIENETLGCCRPKPPAAARHFGIAGHVAGRWRGGFAPPRRRPEGQGFPPVGPGL